MVRHQFQSHFETILRSAATLIVGALLIWVIIAHALGAQAVRQRNPGLLVITASARQPDAAAQLASFLLAAKESEKAASLARMAVLNAPLNVQALTALGLALEQQGRTREAVPILRLAASMGWRNTAGLIWGLKDAALNNNPKRLLEIADALARRQQAGPITTAVFFGALVDPALQREFVHRLATRPSWRPGFFADIHDKLQVQQLDGMKAVLNRLAVTGAPPTPGEKLLYIDRMVQLGAVDRARRYWADNFGITQTALKASPFDNRFTKAARLGDDNLKSAFEWQLSRDYNDAVFFDAQIGTPMLRVQTGAPNGAVLASQIVVLAPGEHILETRLTEGSGAIAPAGWTMICKPSNQPLLRTIEPDRRDELTRIAITVPAQGCFGQLLQLVALERLDAKPIAIGSVTIR